MKPQDVLEFWFGSLDALGCVQPEQRKKWWTKDPNFDDEIRHKFGDTVTKIAAREHQDWLASPAGRLAYIIVLDQFTRNIFRGSGAMYEHDALALQATRSGMDIGHDRAIVGDALPFFYMPLMHSEDIAMQELSVQVFCALAEDTVGPRREGTESVARYAAEHRDIVRRFGRFVHRDELLGRDGTDETRAFVAAGGGF